MKKMYNSFEKRAWLAPALSALALLAAPAAHAQVVSGTPKLEAEDAAVATVSGAGAKVSTAIVGFSGAGFVDYNGSDSGVAFKYTAAAAGLYDIVIRYESQYDFKKGDLVVNGGTRSEIYFNSTKTGAAFRSTTPRRIMLKAGENTISIQKGYNYYGIDYIQIAPSATNVSLTPAATTGRIEAEAGQIFAAQAFLRDGDASKPSGSLYVSGFNDIAAVGSSITLPVNITTTGLYQIAVGARSGDEVGKTFGVTVTKDGVVGSKIITMVGATATPDFKSYTVGKYQLPVGTSTIVITSDNGYNVDIDYVDITATMGEATATRADAAAQKALSVFPNPTNGQDLTVRLESAAARNATVELVNALGQRVLTSSRSLRAGTNQFQLTTDRVAAGMYQLVVRSGDQPVLSHRVMITE